VFKYILKRATEEFTQNNTGEIFIFFKNQTLRRLEILIELF